MRLWRDEYGPDDDGVSPEEAEDLHRGWVEGADRVVISRRLGDDEAIRAARQRETQQGKSNQVSLRSQQGRWRRARTSGESGAR